MKKPPFWVRHLLQFIVNRRGLTLDPDWDWEGAWRVYCAQMQWNWQHAPSLWLRVKCAWIITHESFFK